MKKTLLLVATLVALAVSGVFTTCSLTSVESRACKAVNRVYSQNRSLPGDPPSRAEMVLCSDPFDRPESGWVIRRQDEGYNVSTIQQSPVTSNVADCVCVVLMFNNKWELQNLVYYPSSNIQLAEMGFFSPATDQATEPLLPVQFSSIEKVLSAFEANKQLTTRSALVPWKWTHREHRNNQWISEPWVLEVSNTTCKALRLDLKAMNRGELGTVWYLTLMKENGDYAITTEKDVRIRPITPGVSF